MGGQKKKFQRSIIVKKSKVVDAGEVRE